MPISAAHLSGLAKLADLDDTNWGQWSKTMVMFFRGTGATWIANNSAAVPAEGAAALDGEIVWTIYSHVHDDYKTLIEDEKSGLSAWKILKERFEKSSMARRLKARTEFYQAVHDLSLPVDIFIRKITDARKLLKGLNCEPGDLETADIILLNLHRSWSTVRTAITTQKDEPTLEAVISTLNGSTVDIPVKQEDDIPTFAMAAFNGHHPSMGSGGRRGGSGAGGYSRSTVLPANRDAGNSSNTGTTSHSPIDDKGFRWCDPSNENHCHRCGRPGHIAARCIHDMPQHIKDFVMNGAPRHHSAKFAFSYESYPNDEAFRHAVHTEMDAPPDSDVYRAQLAAMRASFDNDVDEEGQYTGSGAVQAPLRI